jgi:hypothetical protein
LLNLRRAVSFWGNDMFWACPVIMTDSLRSVSTTIMKGLYAYTVQALYGFYCGACQPFAMSPFSKRYQLIDTRKLKEFIVLDIHNQYVHELDPIASSGLIISESVPSSKAPPSSSIST